MAANGKSGAWTGWVIFAACVLMVVGVLNLFQGIAAVGDETYFRTPSGNLLVWDYTAWGVILICFGVLQSLAGMGLFTGSGLARWVAVGLTMLNIIGQIGFLDARPVWTAIVIALDVVVLYALTARWHVTEMADDEGRIERGAGAEWSAEQPGARAASTRAHRPPPSGKGPDDMRQ